jgi:D-lactate dehydrogenase (cytochrome)
MTQQHDCGFLTDLSLDGRVSFDDEDHERFSKDEGPHPAHLPDAVVWPHSTADVSAVLAAANERGVPVTPRSGGSSIEGNPIPVRGGIVLNVIGMDAVEARPADLQAVVGPGIRYDALNDRLAEHGLRFAPGIAAGDLATIGGMIANDASGLNAVRYGVTRDHVRRLEVVLPDGRVIQCGRDVVKTAAGYSLKDLFVGSEGTLGVVTEATLSLEAVPRARRAAVVTFPTREAASEAVAAVMGAGLVPGALEYVDSEAVRVINDATGIGLREEPTLVVELHGNEPGVTADVERVLERCEAAGATDWVVARDEHEIDEVWTARREAYPAACDYREGWDVAVIGDVVVPVSRYPEIVARTAELSVELDVPCPCVGHAGDGNLHFLPLADPDDDETVERAMALNDRVVEAALGMGGTATGEHGVGLGKREFMRQEHADAVDVMCELKEVLDPTGIMNPGKVLPDDPNP